MPVRDLSTLQLGQLLGALLSAVVEGQREATASSLAFVEEVGLAHDDEGHERFRTVTIRYTKLDENQQPAEFTLEVPLLAMVAIPTLVVRTAKISFSYDVTETSQAPSDDQSSPRVRALDGIMARPVILKGIVQRPSVTQNTRETAGVNVEVTVESEPLPLGLGRLLELTEFTVSRPAKDES
jgi:hypothetical protein